MTCYRVWYNTLSSVYLGSIEEVCIYCRMQEIVSGEIPYWEPYFGKVPTKRLDN